MENTVISLNTEAKRYSDNGFHAYRLQFNSVFLAENYSLAYELTQRIAHLSELSEHQLLELSRNYSLLGYSEAALQCLERALLQNPNLQQAILEKLKLLKSLDQTDAYLALLKSSIDLNPCNLQFYQMLHEYYLQENLSDLRLELETKAQLHNLELKPSFVQTPCIQDLDSPADIVFEDPVFIERFLNLFRGRENLHARQWVSSKGMSGYNPVSEPFTHANIRGHLMGLYTLGVYQLNLQNRVKWLVFDIDIAKEHLPDLHDPQFSSWIEEGFCYSLNSIKQVLDTYQIQALYEFSGFKGYHVWILFQNEISASLARGLAQKLAEKFDLAAYPLNLEVFPKQSRVGKNNFGNLVKLPGGIHKVTGLRSHFVQVMQDHLLPLQISDAINTVKTLGPDQVMSLVQALQPDFSTPNNSQEQMKLPNSVVGSETELFEDPLSTPQWLWLKERCFALRSLVSDLESQNFLDAEQKKVITYTLGTLPNGNLIVNALLKKAENSQPIDLLRSPLKGNAMSCHKIRKHLNISTEHELCNCDFSALNAAYDSPVLYWELYKCADTKPAQNQKLRLRETVSKYLDLKKNHQAFQMELKQIEAKLYDLFEETGVLEFDTGFGILKLVQNEEQKTLILELGAKK